MLYQGRQKEAYCRMLLDSRESLRPGPEGSGAHESAGMGHSSAGEVTENEGGAEISITNWRSIQTPKEVEVQEGRGVGLIAEMRGLGRIQIPQLRG